MHYITDAGIHRIGHDDHDYEKKIINLIKLNISSFTVITDRLYMSLKKSIECKRKVNNVLLTLVLMLNILVKTFTSSSFHLKV